MSDFSSRIKKLRNIFVNVILLLFLLHTLLIDSCKGDEVNNDDPLVVTIKSGKLRGKILKDKNGGEFYAFQKIPYAKKPIGNLRFKPLQKAEKWNGTLDATKVAPDCLQIMRNSSEDCIYINIFTHRKPELHPVMFYVYGGALTGGSCNPEDTLGPEFLLTKDIVLVTFNYRFGVLGFLNYEYPENEDIDLTSSDNQHISEEISSNNGFKDQVFALKWVHENIEQFGGDKNRITIIGHSAGAVSVHTLSLSPLTNNLYHGLIMQSGVAISKGLGMNNSAVYMGNILGLDTKNATKLMEGLRNLTESEILDFQTQIDILKTTMNKPELAAVIIEKPGPNSLITDFPWKLIKSGNYYHVPTLSGFLDVEGMLYFVQPFPNFSDTYDIKFFVPYYYDHLEVVALEIDEKYFPKQNYSDIYAWFNVWGYSVFTFDIFRCAFEQMKWSNFYFYEFVYDTELNWSKRRTPNTKNLKGACHGDELGYLFKMNTTPTIEKGSVMDKAIDRMVTMWTNFATYGKPILPEADNSSLFDGQTWLPMAAPALNVFEIGENFTQKVLDTTTYKFWWELYERFSSKLF